MEEFFNKEKLTGLTGTICKCMGIDPPNKSEGICENLVNEIFNKTNNQQIDRLVMFNPDAIGHWLYEKYYNNNPAFHSTPTDYSNDS